MKNELFLEDSKRYIKVPFYREDQTEIYSEYEQNILERTKIVGISNMQKKTIEGDVYWLFSISTYVSLNQHFEREYLSMEMFCEFFDDLLQTYQSMNTFLLDRQLISLRPENIYYDEKEKKYVFLPIANPENNFLAKYEDLFTFFAEICSMDEKELLEYIFQVFGLLSEPDFDEMIFLENISSQRHSVVKKEEPIHMVIEEESHDLEEETTEKTKMRGIFIIGLFLLIFAFWSSFICSYEFKYGIIAMASAILAVCLIGYGLVNELNEQRKKFKT